MYQIPLKHKYTVGSKGRFKGGERPAPQKKRKKIGYDKHVALFGVPKARTFVVDGRTGKGVMRDA